MTSHLDALARLGWNQLWQLTAVVVLVGLAVHFGCRRRPHLAYVLWLLVLVKCLAPPLWSSPTGVFSWIDAPWSPPAAQTALAQATEGPVKAQPVAAEPAAVPVAAEPVAAASAEPASFPPSTASDGGTESEAVAAAVPDRALGPAAGSLAAESAAAVTPASILAIVWLAGAVALGGVLLGRRLCYAILLRRTRVPTDPALAGRVARLARRLGLRRSVAVRVTTQPFGPAIYGAWRPVLVLPQSLVQEGPAQDLQRILAHELIHVRRGDPLVGALQLVAQVLWWFHPLVWWANLRICREREYCCDEEVVATLGCDPARYAQTLLDVLKLRRQLQRALLPGVGASEVTSKRLEKIMERNKKYHPRMPRLGWALLAVGILLVAPGAGITWSGPGDAAPSAALDPPAPSPESVPVNDPVLVGTTPIADQTAPDGTLQERIRAAKPRDVVALPTGVYTGPIVIDKPLVLKGQDAEKCILEVTADEPALSITSRSAVLVESITIKWQLATSQRRQGPSGAVAVQDGTATLRGCRVAALGNPQRCPAAVQCLGFSNVKLENSRFEGFEFSINYGGGAEGSVTDCVVLGPGHCGVTVFSGSKLEVARSIVTGSRFHGLRCTGGKLTVRDSLIVNNRNRGVYLGNKPGDTTIRNSVIYGNGTGVSVFGQSEATLAHNVILKSDYSGVDARDSARLTVRDNVFSDNPKGFVLVAETGRSRVTLGQNTFWRNAQDTENVERPAGSLTVDPQFADAAEGDFAPQAEELKQAHQGLTDPSALAGLWRKWRELSGTGAAVSEPAAPEAAAARPAPGNVPRIVSTSPAVGATDVDPSITEITVTFDRDMGGGFSWTGGGPDHPTSAEGKPAFWRDRRTCVLPVTLERGRYYRVGINSTSHQNFQSADGTPAQPSAIYFTTQGASRTLQMKVKKPEIVEMNPPNGAKDVSPNLTVLRVTFNVPMGEGFSWTGGGPNYPDVPEGKRPTWSRDRRTCLLPVSLKPGWDYRLGLNSPSHKNFQSAGGVPLEPVVYTFSTRSE